MGAQAQVQTQFDNKKQFERVLPHLLEGEQLFYVYDLVRAGSGFIGITDRRLLFIDQDFLDRKDAALVSIPYNRITYVASQTERKRFARDSSSITVAVSGRTFEFEFHGTEKSQRAFRILNHFLCRS